MQELIKLIVDNSIGVVCVGYLIYFQSTTMKEMTRVLNSINIRLSIIEENLNIGEKNESVYKR